MDAMKTGRQPLDLDVDVETAIGVFNKPRPTDGRARTIDDRCACVPGPTGSHGTNREGQRGNPGERGEEAT
jgi:hypothetical protein